MRTVLVALLVFAACRKSEQQAPAPTPVPSVAPVVSDAAVVVDAAPQADVELLHAIPTTIRVSSTVANPKILPAHIADRDLATAWNSKTGELVGAWIEIAITGGAEGHVLKLTAGFTAKGPKNEDWFTMNPRIEKLTVEADGKAAGTFTLDVARRDLQAFEVTATSSVRITIAEVVPGSKKAWREASISEIELWGRPPAGWVAPKVPLQPAVEVGADAVPAASDDPCAAIEAEREKFVAEHANDRHEGPGGEDHAYPPRCDLMEVTGGDKLPAPWSVSALCEVRDEIYGPKTCSVVVSDGKGVASVDVTHDFQSAEMRGAVEAEDVLPASPGPEVLVRIRHPGGESFAVCRRAPKLACSTPLLIGGTDWQGTVRFDKAGGLVLDKFSGDPPSGALGPQSLAWPAN